MLIEKLVDGVIELDTPIGPRYLQPSFSQRVVLMWTFRNFFSLPSQVLRPGESRLIDQLCCENRFVSPNTVEGNERPIIGRIERRPPTLTPVVAAVLPVRKPAASANSAVSKQSEEAASA